MWGFWSAIRIRIFRGFMLTIDYSPAVAEEARAGNFNLVIAYHPPIFQAHQAGGHRREPGV
jgi:putative NIF3 family GTP cyclohydrolase 1 type 2